MTDQKAGSLTEPKQTQPKDTLTGETQPRAPRRSYAVALSLLASLVTIALIVGTLFYTQQKLNEQTLTLQQLGAKLDQQYQQSHDEQGKVSTTLSSLRSALQEAQRVQATTQQQMETLHTKLDSISNNNIQTWSIAQADYLVKLAGRKLWSEEDPVTAAVLLKSADQALAETDDPSLVEVRRAITEDLGELATLNQVDYAGMILKLYQLTNDIDNLPLADKYVEDSPMDGEKDSISSSLREWRNNLNKTWHRFIESFVSIKRRDSTNSVPFLAPDQETYLRENIRSRLLIAAQAIPRHQNEIYLQSLEAVSTWIRAVYDTDNPATKAFLAQLEALSQQTTVLDLPENLKSPPLLDKLMQTRVRNLFALPSLEAGSAGG